MPLVYIHGVSVRSADHGLGLTKPFTKWLSKAVDGKEDALSYFPVFWGGSAAKFRWKLLSRPRTQILNLGAESFPTGLARTAPHALLRGGQLSQQPVAGPVVGAPAQPTGTILNLSAVKVDDRADVLVDLYLAVRQARSVEQNPPPLLTEKQLAELPFVADEIARSWDAAAGNDKQKLTALLLEIDKKLTGTLGMGGNNWLESIGEVAARALAFPGDIVSTVLGELRPGANDFVANFLGDVLVYINERGTRSAPGIIPRLVMDGLRKAKAVANGKPIVVLTHSMGGQLFYDVITHFVEADAELRDIEIAHWITCGSQVSFFAELTQFLGEDLTVFYPQKLPRPKRVKRWTNYYDENDPVGFVMKEVFSDVTDIKYDTGYGLALAHTGFLQRTSFFKKVADRLAGGGPGA
jgi:hypothetical protein